MTATLEAPATAPAQKVTQVRVLRSELTKLRSLRSTVWSLLAALVLILGLSILVPAVRVAHWPPTDPGEMRNFDPVGISLGGTFLAQMAVGVLGVLLMTGEYATGMIRATLAAVPKRLPVLWAKLGVFGAVSLALVLPAVLAAFFIGQSILSSQHIDTTFGSPGVARAVFGSALYVVAVGLLGLALGALLRNTAAAISTLFGLLFVLPLIVRLLPSDWQSHVSRYLPLNAGQAVTNLHNDAGSMAPWSGFTLFCVYVIGVVALAAWQLRRRDV
jgi:ABC-type transport system involved in multi-copper enzyme maturation permease subunit